MTKVAMQNITKICRSRLSDTTASDRLQRELDYIAKNEVYAEVFTVAGELAAYSRKLGYYASFHGCIGSSLIAFLLGITETDPLKYNLPFEIFTGVKNDKPLDIELTFDARFISSAKKYIQEHYPDIAIVDRGELPAWLVFGENEDKSAKISIAAIEDYSELKELSDKTGIDMFNIPLNDTQTLSMMRSAESDADFTRGIVQITKPEAFEDFVQISGWAHSTYRCASDCITEMPAFREDVFLYLLQSGIDNATAYEITEHVGKGNGLTDEHISVLSNVGVSKQYIYNLNQIQYLFPKAHCIALTMTEYRLTWFKTHYPNKN